MKSHSSLSSRENAMNSTSRSIIISVIGLLIGAASVAQEPRPFFYGTFSEATVPGTSIALASYWSLCFDSVGNMIWDIDGYKVSGQVLSFDGKRLCVEHEIKEECFEIRAEYASTQLQGITISSNGRERHFTVVQDNINQCQPNAVG